MPASSSITPSLQKNTIRKLKLGEAEEKELSTLARFGPIYGVDTEANIKAKDSAWKHILQKGGEDEAGSSYMRSIMKIEKEAIESYDGTIVDQLKRAPHEFRRTMVTDGCFFLQLALHVLGAGELLKYSPKHPYFGTKIDSTSWIPAMFFPGNQIPCVVLQALMEQDFFQDVMLRGKWQRPADDLAKLVLYQTVVEPQLQRKPPHQPPSDILQALHSLLLGSGHKDPSYSEMRVFQDLETAGEDSTVKFPSAGELKKLGIKLAKAEPGITNIRFKNYGYSAYLFLPPFTIDRHTKDLLTSLASHELSLSESDRELTAYLRFMRDLAHTYKDFKILEKKGIIRVADANLKGTMVHMLDKLVSLHKSKFTLNFRQIRRKITDYGGPPWRLISIILGVLTVVQTIFTVLSYCIPRT